jgi:hypothetical protein
VAIEDELTLDGNAAAGALQEVFALEVTAATGTCSGCGATAPLGSLVAYVHAPGVVLRCRGCNSVMIRVVRGDDRCWLDLRGVRSLELRVNE